MFDAARRAGVPRVVYGGSNHAIGFTPRCELLRADVPRPDTNYGVSKAFGESVGRFYADRYSMQVLVSCASDRAHHRPRSPRMLATWLSPDDAARLVDACLRGPNLEMRSSTGSRPIRGPGGSRSWPGRSATSPRTTPETFAPEVLAAHEPAAGDDAEAACGGGRWTSVLPFVDDCLASARSGRADVGCRGSGLSSFTNFGLSVLAGRLLGTAGLGVVFLGFSMYLLVLSAVRAIMEPFVVATSAMNEEEQQDRELVCALYWYRRRGAPPRRCSW